MTPLAGLLKAVRRLHEGSPALQRFGAWPDDLREGALSPVSCEAAQSLGVRALPGTRATAPVIRALRKAAPELEWRQTYSEAEVGKRFLQTYGYIELFGPTGHFHSDKLRGYIGFWGPDLTYDWHAHEAEEFYFTLAGRAVFSAHGAPNIQVGPGDAREHTSNQPHLMLTMDQPYLAYVLWRGEGLGGVPQMVVA